MRLSLSLTNTQCQTHTSNAPTVCSSNECSWPAQHGQSPLTLSTTVGGKTNRSCQKHESLSLHDCLCSGCHTSSVSFVSLKSHLCTSLTIHNTTDNNCIISHAHNTHVLESTALLTGIHPLLVTNKGESASPIINICQCQLQTPLSVISTLQGKADYAGNVEKVTKTVLRSTARNVDIT